MDPRLTSWLLGSAGAALLAAATLVVVKLTHRVILRWRGVRSAQYLAAIGELLSRRIIPEHPAPGWGQDPLFHQAIIEYRHLLTGEDRHFIDELIEKVGILEVLIERINTKFPPARRLESVTSFVDMATERSIPQLRELLGDPSHHVVIHAAKGLSQLGDLGSIHSILDRAKVSPPWHAARLADSLAHFGEGAGAEIRSWIEAERNVPNPSVDSVALAARVLGLIVDLDAEKLLLDMLVSEEPEWRVTAASALGNLGGEDTVAALIEALTDDSWPVRARAATALGDLAVPGATSALAPMLTDSVWWVRQNAAEAIAGLPGGTSTLIKAVAGPDPFAADAALHQLTMRGKVAEAAHRAQQGEATVQDLDLLARMDAVASTPLPES